MVFSYWISAFYGCKMLLHFGGLFTKNAKYVIGIPVSWMYLFWKSVAINFKKKIVIHDYHKDHGWK